MPVRLANGYPEGRPGMSRRDVLRLATAGTALAGATVAGGCTLFAPAVRWHDGPDRIAELRASAADLADHHDRVMSGYPELADRLAPLRDAHRRHVQALDRELAEPARPGPSATGTGQSPTGFPTDAPTDDPAAALAALRAAETAGAQQAKSLCLTGPAWRAALVGSIAAARASHVEALT